MIIELRFWQKKEIARYLLQCYQCCLQLLLFRQCLLIYIYTVLKQVTRYYMISIYFLKTNNIEKTQSENVMLSV